jgi:hypothetical protein
MLIYELLPGRRTRPGASDDDEEDLNDMGMTVFDVFSAWFNESRTSLIAAVTMLSLGTYLASSHDLRSTFFCSSQDRSILVVFLQWVGLVLDATIVIVLWRILAWARTTKGRLRTLSGILLAASLGSALLYWASRVALPATPQGYHFRGLGSLYVFDVAVDGLAFSVFLVSTSLLATEGSPLSLVGIIAFLFGLMQAARWTTLTGTWENISPATIYCALILLCVGFSWFVYANNIVSVIFIHRAIVVFLLVVVTVVATIYTPVRALQIVDHHPLVKIIYDARTVANRWMVDASISKSLKVAVEEYRERHNGREPPPKFDIWYNFAKEKHSVIIDHFPQMGKDLLPFWGVSPSKIREDAGRAATEPDMAILQIRGGKPQHNLPPASPYKAVMDDLVDVVKGFAQHLPDMELPINMDERPRVLAPFDHVQRLTRAASRKRINKLLPRTSESRSEVAAVLPRAADDKLQDQETFTPVRALREMTALTCPPGTKARAGTHWDIRDFCASCAKPQSQGQYLTNWPLSQDICHQPDLLRLHNFHMTPPGPRPLQELLPVFSRAKTDSYSDILIPLRRMNEPGEPPAEKFDMKGKNLFWRGKVDRVSTSHEQVRGGHQERLVHLLTTPARSERTRLLLQNKNGFAFEQVPTGALNDLLPFDVAFTRYTACKGNNNNNCEADAVGKAFRQAPDKQEPLRSQFVMVVDTDHGPPRELLRTLQSSSVPFYASIFKEWHSERLMPWVHFVPVDLRYHALHSTFAYFVGMQKQDGRKLNGREVEMVARLEDAKWIADQGKSWAGTALRREDREVYLFRLLLEWGRIIDDNRDGSGFVLA